ncbi:MAG: signal peptidase I [Bacilli bacterium]
MGKSLNEEIAEEELVEKLEKPVKEISTKEHKRKLIYLSVLSSIVLVMFIVGSVLIFNASYYYKAPIDGLSMYPTFNSDVKNDKGEVIKGDYEEGFSGDFRVEFGIIDTHIRTSDLKRFDIVSFRTSSSTTSSIKTRRLIGLPGEKLEYIDNKLYINDKHVEEKDYGNNKWEILTNNFTFKLKDNEFYMLGDNRSYSSDSRHFGPIKLDYIVGKLVAIKGTCTTKGSYIRELSFFWPRYY